MKARVAAVALCLMLMPSVSSAQWVVFDPSTFAQAVAIVQQVQSQYALWEQMSKGLAGIQAYRLSPLDVPLLVQRDLGPPVLYGEDLPSAALVDTDSRLTSALSNAARLAAFSQALTSRIATLQSDVSTPGKSMTSILDTQAAGQLIAVQQAEARQRILEAQYDLQLQQALRERDDRAVQVQQGVNLKHQPPTDWGVDRLGQWGW